MRRVGRVTWLTILEMAEHVRPGITTIELDRVGGNCLEKYGARSAPIIEYDFPGHTCISVNDVAAHGVPDEYQIKDGDIVNIDVSAEMRGFFGDAGVTLGVGCVCDEKMRIIKCAKRCLDMALKKIRPGIPISIVGKVVEKEAAKSGLSIIRNLAGHGIGRHLHEEPHHILTYYDKNEKRKFQEGMAAAIEVFISSGDDTVHEEDNGWTLRTPNGSIVAQFEHTVIIGRSKTEILTKA